ncbi:MAG: hypothetical protein C0404_11995 [Verrucomicrobia bacterium]|nr:hypothetical protein [Verrucomicrobiota bacterium]
MTALEQMDDLALLNQYVQQGDQDALETLLKRHADMAYRTAFRYMRDPADAEDAVQMAFVKVVRTVSDYRGGEGVRVWIMKVVAGMCRDMIRSAVRRRNREQQAFEEHKDDVAEVDHSTRDMAELVKLELDRLPELYRLPIWLHHCEGMTLPEVSKTLSISENTVRSQTTRGMAMLRKRLGQAGVGASEGAIMGVFPLLMAESASRALITSVADIVRETGIFTKAALAAKSHLLAGGATTLTISATKILLGVAAVAAVAGTAFIFRDSGRQPETPDKIAPLEERAQPGARLVDYHWDFKTRDSTNDLKVNFGSMRYLPDGGSAGSGCIESGPELTELLIDVPIDSLPVVVAYRGACVLPEPRDKYLIQAYWMSYGPVAHFYGLGERGALTFRGTLSNWEEAREYVAETYVDSWLGNVRTGLSIVQRAPDSRFRLAFRGGHRIDDLRIRSIRPDELPDVSQYLAAVSNIPSEKREGTVLLPQLKPGKDFKQVKVTFQPAKK